MQSIYTLTVLYGIGYTMEDQSKLLEIDRYLARTHAFILVEPESYIWNSGDRQLLMAIYDM